MADPSPRQKLSGALPAGAQPSANGRWEGTPSPNQTLTAWGPEPSSRQYITGANTQNTFNGWNTPFMRNFQTTFWDPNTDRTTYFEQKKDGIALWDDQRADVPETERYKVGDVFQGGKKVGNLRDTYGEDMYRQIMTPLMLSASEQQNGVSLESKIAENNQTVAAGASRREYDEQVEQVKDEWGNTQGQTIAGGAIATGLTGMGFGATIGSFLGPGGTLIGGAVGGVGGLAVGAISGWLNNDEWTDIAARGEVQARMMERNHPGLGDEAGRLQTAAQLYGKAANPVGGLIHGFTELTQTDDDGGPMLGAAAIGDRTVAYYDTDDEGNSKRPGWLTAVDVVGGLGDSLMQMSNPLGATLYTAQMGSQVLGSAGQLAITGETFDERTGTFDNVYFGEDGGFNAGTGAAAWGSVGIDLVQMGLARGLGSTATRLGKSLASDVPGAAPGVRSALLGESRLTNWVAGREAKAASREDVGAFKFTRDDQGRLTEKVGYNASVMAPADFIQVTTAKMWARATRMREKSMARGKLTAEELYASATKLTDKGPATTAALVNGFAEGGEEAIQAVLEPLSHEAHIDGYEVAESFFRGVTMGAGFTAGSRLGTNGRARRDYDQYSSLHDAGALSGPKLSEEDYKALDPELKAMMKIAHPVIAEGLKTTAQEVVDRQKLNRSKNQVLIGRANDAVVAGLEKEENAANVPATDNSQLITQAAHGIDDHHVVSSVNTVKQQLDTRLEELKRQEAAARLNPQQQQGPAHQNARQIAGVRQAAQDLAGMATETSEIFYLDGVSVDGLQALVDAQNKVFEFAYQVTRNPRKAQEALTDINELRNEALRIRTLPNPSPSQLEALNRIIAHADALENFVTNLRPPRSVGEAIYAQALSLMFQRDPPDSDGSFQYLLPQIDLVDSIWRADNYLKTTQGLLKAISGDFDGDRINTRMKALFDENSFLELRSGNNLLGATQGATLRRENGEPVMGTEVRIGKRTNEEVLVRQLVDAVSSTNTAQRNYANDTYDQMAIELKSIIPNLTTVVDDFIQSLKDGNVNAREQFLNTLATFYKPLVNENKAYDNVWFALNSAYHRHMQAFQLTDSKAQVDEVRKDLPTHQVAPVLPSSRYRVQAGTEAVSYSHRVWLDIEGADMFRKWQALWYSEINTAVAGSPTDSNAAIREMQELISRLARTQPGDATALVLNAADDITAEVIRQITRTTFNAQGMATEGGMRMLGLMANMGVPNFYQDASGQWQRGEGGISLTQLLLRQQVAAARRRNADLLLTDTDLQAKYNKLEKLEAGQAFVTVFGGFQARELLGPDADVLGPSTTINQLYANYMNQDENGRADEAAAMRSHTTYVAAGTDRHNLPITQTDLDQGMAAYNPVVDAIIEAGNKEISFNRNTQEVEGVKGRSSQRVTKSFQTAIKELQTLMSQRGMKFNTKDTREWKRLLTQREPELGQRYLKMLTDLQALAILPQDGDAVFWPNWLFEILTMDPAQAEMEFFRQTKLAQWLAIGQQADKNPRAFEGLNDRWMQLFYRLADMQRRDPSDTRWAEFQERMLKMTDLKQFVFWVNTEVRGNEAPFAAWESDVAAFDPSTTKGGWQKTAPGSDQRTAVKEFESKVMQFSKSVADQTRARMVDSYTIAKMRAAQANPGGDNQELLLGMDRHIRFIGKYPTPMDPEAITQVLVAAEAPLVNPANKGVAADGYALLGSYLSRTNSMRWSTPEQVVMGSLTAYSTEELGNDPSYAMRRTMHLNDETGKPITNAPLSTAEILELYRDEENHPMLMEMLQPGMYAPTINDQVDKRYITNLSITELVDGKSMRNKIHGNDPKSIDNYLSFIGAHAGIEPLLKYLSAVRVAQHSGRRTELTSGRESVTEVQQAKHDLVQLLRMIGAATRGDRSQVEVKDENGNTVTASKLAQIARELKLGLQAKAGIDSYTDPLAKRIMGIAMDSYRIGIEAQYQADPNAFTAQQRDEALAAVDRAVGTDFVQQVVAKYRDYTDPTTQYELYKWVWDHPQIAGKAFNNEGIKALVANQDFIDDATHLPNLTNDEWEDVANAVIASAIDRSVSSANGGEVFPIPDCSSEESLRFHDPSYRWLVDDLFDDSNPLVLAARELAEDFGVNDLDIRSKDIVQEAQEGLLNTDRLGTYTGAMPALLWQSQDRINSAAAKPGISRGGSVPDHKVTEAIATERTYLVPDDNMRTSVTLGYEQLKNFPPESNVMVQRPFGRNPEPMRLGLLDGRFTNSLKVKVKATGLDIGDLMSIRNSPAHQFTDNRADPNYGHITRQRMADGLQMICDAMNRASPALGLQPQDLEIEVLFFHPLDVPATVGDLDNPNTKQWANNLYFEGTALPVGDSYDSLTAAGAVSPGGADSESSRRALDAAKYHQAALAKAQEFTFNDKLTLETDWQRDVGGMLVRKMNAVMSADLDGNGCTLPHQFQNVVLKELKMRHWVRYFSTTTGQVELMSMEEAIEWQRVNGAFDNTFELYRMADAQLRTMLGETGRHGIAGQVLKAASNDPYLKPRYRGRIEEAHRQALPGIFQATEGQAPVQGSVWESNIKYRSHLKKQNPMTGLNPTAVRQFQAELVRLQAEAMDIQRARANDPTYTKNLNDANNEVTNNVKSILFDRVTFDLLRSAKAVPTGNVDQKTEREIDQKVMDIEAEKYRQTGYQAVRYYSHEAKVIRNPLYHRVGLDAIRNSPDRPKRDWNAADDMVIVDVDSFASQEKRKFSELRKVLDVLMRQGVQITLLSPTGAQNDLLRNGQRILWDNRFDLVPGTKATFTRPKTEGLPLTLQAEYSRLKKKGRRDTHGLSAALVTRHGNLGENGAQVMDPSPDQTQVYHSDPVPIIAWGKSQLVNAETIDDTLNTIRNARTELLDQVKDPEAKRKLADSLDKVQLLNAAGVYDPDTAFGPGDIIPIILEDDRILLYRHGHKPPENWQEMNKLFKPATAQVAMYSPEVMEGATTREGNVIYFAPDDKWGLRAVLITNLQTLGGRWIFEFGGHKITLSGSPKDLLMPDSLPYRQIKVMVGYADTLSKENYPGLLRDFGEAFTNLGIDFSREVAGTLFNKEPSLVSASEIESAMEMLNAYARQVRKVDVALVNDAIQAGELGAVFRDVIQGSDAFVSPGIANYMDRISEALTPQAKITRGILLYLMEKDSAVSDIISSPGVLTEESLQLGSYTREMPELFTQMFDQSKLDSELRAYVMKQLNGRIHNRTDAAGNAISGIKLNLDFSVTVVTEGKQAQTIPGFLQFARLETSDANPELVRMAQERRTSQIDSRNLREMASMAVGVRLSATKDLAAGPTAKLLKAGGTQAITSGDDLLNLMKAIPKEELTGLRRPFNISERIYADGAHTWVLAHRKEFDYKRWEWSDIHEDAWKQKRLRLIEKLGLHVNDAYLVDYWVRYRLGRPVPQTEEEQEAVADKIIYEDAIQMLDVMLGNVDAGLLPTTTRADHVSRVPLMWMHDLAKLHRAAKKSGKWWLAGSGPNAANPKSWNDWARVALSFGSDPTAQAIPEFIVAVDGNMHSYHDAGVDFAGLPMSTNMFKNEQLLDPRTASLSAAVYADNPQFLSVMPSIRMKLSAGELTAAADTVEKVFGGAKRGLSWITNASETQAEAKKLKAEKRWRVKKEKADPVKGTTEASLIEKGHQNVTDGTVTNAVFRTILHIRAAMTLINPMLWLAAPVEGWINDSLEATTNTATGVTTWSLTPEQRRVRKSLLRAAGSNQKVKGMIYSEYALQSVLHNAGPTEKFWAGMSKVGGTAWQDPYYGMRADAVMHRYVTTALREIQNLDGMTTLTYNQALVELQTDPEYLKKNHPDAHRMAINCLLNGKSVKTTVFAAGWKGFIDPLSERPGLLVQASTTLMLKLPFMFAGYTANRAVNILGLQGWDAIAAQFLHGRSNPIFGRIQAFLANKDYDENATIDMSHVIESIDLSQSIVKAGITHSSLFMLGMLAGELGLSGEDEEDRRRRKAAQYQGFGYLYDPEDLVNDFRNRDVIYLDWLPFNMGELFRVTDDTDAGGRHAAAQMNWVLKSILNPIIGFEKFFLTGNPWEMVWAYKDAFYSMPLVNTMMWEDGMDVFAELAASAQEAEKSDTPQSISAATDFWVKAVMNLERMLMENSFISQLYQASDKYDRDAWALPERGADGKIVTNRQGFAEASGLLNEQVLPDGTVKRSYVGRDVNDAVLHGYTENRPVLALLANLFTSFQPGGGDYWRTQMVQKSRYIKKDTADIGEAEKVIRDLYQEAIHPGEAKAVAWGLWKGSVSLDSAALEGFYIPFEMRQNLEVELKQDLIKDGLDKGLTKYKAEQRMWKIWKGSTTTGKPGMGALLWSDKISYKQSDGYFQLNTTYTMGPDGKVWATGISRDMLTTLGGILPLAPFNSTGLPGDSRMNAVDAVRGINTGMRALEKIPDNIHVEQPKDAAPAAPAQYTPYQFKKFPRFRRFGRRGGGGGGGGGGGSFTRLNPPEQNRIPYSDYTPKLNVSNPLIRRANIHRERVESQKGRLNPWQ